MIYISIKRIDFAKIGKYGVIWKEVKKLFLSNPNKGFKVTEIAYELNYYNVGVLKVYLNKLMKEGYIEHKRPYWIKRLI